MNSGRIVEQGPARQILEDPQHPYTRALVKAAPSVAAVRLRPEAFRRQGLNQPADAAASAPAKLSPAPAPPAAVVSESAAAKPAAPPDYIVEVEGLTKVFPVRGQKEDFVAVKDVSFAIPRGETVAIVG